MSLEEWLGFDFGGRDGELSARWEDDDEESWDEGGEDGEDWDEDDDWGEIDEDFEDEDEEEWDEIEEDFEEEDEEERHGRPPKDW